MANGNTQLFLTDYIKCPSCGEHLAPADLEVFSRCPYCNFEFQRDNALEDFVLGPVVHRWINQRNNQFPSH